MSMLSRHSKAGDGGTAVEQTQINRGTLVELGEVPTGQFRIAIGFPAAAAGEIAPLILDKALHIGKGNSAEQQSRRES